MSKHTCIAVLSLMFAPLLHSQMGYGVDGVVASAGHSVLWGIERKDLITIEKGQDQLLIANTVLALEQAKLMDISNEHLTRLGTTDQAIANANVLLQITEHGTELFDIQADIYEITQTEPIAAGIILPAIYDLITEQAFLLADIAIATADGERNLMDGAERLLFMRGILQDIDQINTLAREVRGQAILVVQILSTDIEGEQPQLLMDATMPMQRIQEDIGTLLND